MTLPVMLSVPLVLSFPHGRDHFVWISRSISIIVGAVLVATAAWGFGEDAWTVVRRSIRLLKPTYLAIAFAFPVGISALIPTSQYLLDRIHWAAHDFGKYAPPQFAAYFSLPDPWLLLLFFAAFAEEIIFRGLLQLRFVQRYGLERGIFLVGIVWAAFHFFGDSYSRPSDPQVLLQLGSRLFITPST